MKPKRVLFIGIGFYDYEKAIVKEFRKLGFEVDYSSEVPPNTLTYRYNSRLRKQNKLEEIRQKHSAKIVQNAKQNYNFVFIIKCEYFTTRDLGVLRKKNPQAKFILYLWDSLLRFPVIKKKLSYFDEVFSFDRKDCLANQQIKFNPLFYRDEYNHKNDLEPEPRFDAYLLGWYHTDRLLFVKKIALEFDKTKVKYNMLLFTGYFSYLFQSVFGGELKGNKKFLIFKPVSASANYQNMINAKVTIDIAHPMQSGLTMRTIELLGAQKKIITTNNDIINYDFYHPNNVMIIDRENPTIDVSFFSKKFTPTPEDVLKKYTITNWISKMIS